MADPFNPKFVDLVRNYTTTIGTGSFTLSTAVNGFAGIATALSAGDQFYYSCIGVDKPAEREVGRGTLTASGEVSRAPINGTLTDFTKGSKAIALIAAAEWFDGIASGLAAAELGSAKIAADRASLAAFDESKAGAAIVQEEPGGGTFQWRGGDQGATIAGDPAQAICVPSVADPSGASGAWMRVHDGVLRPEWFGARGDGVTNDSDAFGALSAFINAADGGTVELSPGAVYIVGKQTLALPSSSDPAWTKYTWVPDYMGALVFTNCTRPVVVRGNGATFKCAPGLRFGCFSTVDGSPDFSHDGVLYTGNGIGTPYVAMIRAEACTNIVHISDLELDGNRENLTFGGYYGDVNPGYQIAGYGVYLFNNTGQITLENINSHHQPTDGLIGNGPGVKTTPENVTIINCHGNDNGRNGLSVVGGHGWQFHKCRFDRNGALSGPMAGIDLEAEGGKYVRGCSFYDCVSENNGGTALSSIGALTTGNMWYRGRLLGTNSYCYYGTSGEDAMKFFGTTFLGGLSNVFTETFTDCIFSDDVTKSPTGTLYYPAGAYVLQNLGERVHFLRCRVDSHRPGNAILNYPQSVGIWDTCKFVIKSGALWLQTFHPYRFKGLCEFISEAGSLGSAVQAMPLPGGLVPTGSGLTSVGDFGEAEHYWYVTKKDGTRWLGPATIDPATNKKIYYASATYDPPSLAAGAKDAIQTMTVTGAVLGDKVTEVSFSMDLAGAHIHAWVSAANTVSYYAINDNGANPLDLGSGTLRVKVVAA